VRFATPRTLRDLAPEEYLDLCVGEDLLCSLCCLSPGC